MMNDSELLASCPDYLSIGAMLKATPLEEGGRRFIYIEASNEALDQQNEVVMQKALKDSADWYLKYGNLDIDHYTQIGAKVGIPNHASYEIGQPVEVAFNGGKTFVKGEILYGSGPVADQANQFWSSLTERNPPAKWYPSVGGSVLERAVEIDPKSKTRKAFIKKVRWSNIGFSKTPVNQTVPTVATVPIGALTKSWSMSGLDFAKALEAGYGTDSASLTGGAALRQQSLDHGPANYFDFRNQLAEEVRKHAVGKNPGVQDLVRHCVKRFNLSLDEAAEWVERFTRDLKTGLNQRSKP
jgi:hypothetical protein